jgi:hypothetical protein
MLLCVDQGYSQISPSSEATINYRMTGFEVPRIPNASKYTFHIAEGNITDEDILRKNAFTHSAVHQNTCIILLPSFGIAYSWLVSYTDKNGKEIGKTGLYHFSTGKVPYTDADLNGLLVITAAKHHKDLFVLVDGVLVIYDIEGYPIWYMPDVQQIEKRDVSIRDFKPTPDGTFTFMTIKGAYEVDYDGKIIWQAPNDGKVSGSSTESYHHEFTKMADGHYLVAGAEALVKRIPDTREKYFADDDTTVQKGIDGNYYKQITSGTLIEYDVSGKVVWSWKASEHFNDGDYFWPKSTLNKPYDGNTYMNAFEFDAVHKVIYVSFKNINRIIKISYPEGDVLNTYGEQSGDMQHRSPFYGQHSCRINPRTGGLYVYNNNHNDFEVISKGRIDADGYLISHVVKYQQPVDGNGILKANWDLGCKLVLDKTVEQVTIRGGSIAILDDDCILVNMGTMNHMMIINKNKELIWDAAPYLTDAKHQKIAMIPYRCNYIQKKDLSKFVFRKRS